MAVCWLYLKAIRGEASIARLDMVFTGHNMSVVQGMVGSGQYFSAVCCERDPSAYQYIPSASKAKNLKINYQKIIVFNIELFLKMNEQVGESGANRRDGESGTHRRETEQEKACKKQEDKNAVQGSFL